MQDPNTFFIFTSRLNNLNIRYMITGSVASIVYGEPRMTHDIDLVMESEKHLHDIKGILSISADHINFEELEKRVESLGLSQEWQLAVK